MKFYVHTFNNMHVWWLVQHSPELMTFFFPICCIHKCFILQTVIEADISVKPLRPCVVTGH